MERAGKVRGGAALLEVYWVAVATVVYTTLTSRLQWAGGNGLRGGALPSLRPSPDFFHRTLQLRSMSSVRLQLNGLRRFGDQKKAD